MPDDIVINVRPGGGMAAIYDDDFPFEELGFSAAIRAGVVEPIQSGPCAGLWFVDMSPLGSEYRFCLWPPSRKRSEALAAERSVVERWLVRGEKTEAYVIQTEAADVGN